jgi:predicted DNA-binding transcriptional regulator AlpA
MSKKAPEASATHERAPSTAEAPADPHEVFTNDHNKLHAELRAAYPDGDAPRRRAPRVSKREAAPPRAPKRFLGMPEVLERYPLAKSTIYRLMEKKEFPRATTIGGRVMWDEAKLDAYDEQRARTEEALDEAKTREKHARQDAAERRANK